jgi:hypothetical protein
MQFPIDFADAALSRTLAGLNYTGPDTIPSKKQFLYDYIRSSIKRDVLAKEKSDRYRSAVTIPDIDLSL